MVKIDKNKCSGCGACASTCPEGFEIVNEKAKVRDENAKCINEVISACPIDAISIKK